MVESIFFKMPDWFYLDPQGEIQGPFTEKLLKSWFEQGFLTVSLPIKQAGTCFFCLYFFTSSIHIYFFG